MRVYKGISGSALGRVASAMGLPTRLFRRGKFAHRITAMQEPELASLGGNGVDVLIRSVEHPEYPPLNPNQVYMPNPREQYVVVEDTANGSWITAGGILVSVYQVEDDGTIVQEVPGDFAPEYDDYLKTGEEPIGQGSEWSVVLDYFNLDVAEIDRWKNEVLDSLKTGQVEEQSPDEEVAIISIHRQGSAALGNSQYVASVVGGTGMEYAFTSESIGRTASRALHDLADAWSREGFEE